VSLVVRLDQSWASESIRFHIWLNSNYGKQRPGNFHAENSDESKKELAKEVYEKNVSLFPLAANGTSNSEPLKFLVLEKTSTKFLHNPADIRFTEMLASIFGRPFPNLSLVSIRSSRSSGSSQSSQKHVQTIRTIIWKRYPDDRKRPGRLRRPRSLG